MRRSTLAFRIVGFLLTAVAITSPAYLYLGWRLVTPSTLGTAGRWVAWGLLGAHMLLLPVALVVGRVSSRRALGDALQWAGYVGMGFLALVLTFLLIRDAGWWVVRGIDALPTVAGRGVAAAGPGPAAPVATAGLGLLPADLERRRLLLHGLNLGILGLAVGLAGRGYREAVRRAEVKRVTVPIEDLPPELEGFTIAQITDVHLGPTIKGDHLREVVEAVNELDADLVAVTGDLVDGSVRRLGAEAAPLAGLRSREGTYFVTGNHEYYSGVHEWVDELRRLGLTVLLNEHELIERGGATLALAGVTDLRAGSMVPEHRSDPEAAIAGAPAGATRVLLAHQPGSSRRARAAGYHLQISGHTHGGQFWPWHLVVRLVTPFVAGLHRAGAMWVYVSRGTGYWGPPLRLAAPSEITRIELRRA